MPKHLNKTAIEWTDYTWNVVTGCENICPYCYARTHSRGFHRSFEPTFHLDRLSIANTPIGAKVFVCSMGELFGPWVSARWTDAVLNEVRELPDVTFQLLTKFPENLAQWNPWPDNAWVGATVDNNESLECALKGLSSVQSTVRFISFEPLQGPIDTDEAVFCVLTDSSDIQELAWFGLHDLDWVIVGAETGNRKGKPALEDVHEWAAEIIHAADAAGVPVLLKDNLRRPIQRREWPVPQRQP